MGTGQPQGLGDFKEYTSGQSDATTWLPSGSGNADYVQVIGAGTVVVTTEKGNNRTITTDAAEPAAVIDGPFSALVSTTATRVRMGIGKAPPIMVPPTGVASGSTIADAGSFTAQTTVEGALQEIYQDLKSTQLLVPVRFGMLAAGTPLAAWADNASSNPGITLANSKAAGYRWNNNASQTAIWTVEAVPVPYEADVTANATMHILCSKVGATLADATTFTVTAFVQDVAALHDADSDFGGTSSAIAGDATSKTVQDSTLTLALADLAAAAAPAGISFSIKPTDGTLGTDDIIVHAVFVLFKRKLRVA